MTTRQLSASYRVLFARPHRAVTVGLLTLMSVVAFEALGGLAFLLQRQSDPGKLGFLASAAQPCDQLSAAVTIGIGGALLAHTDQPSAALPGFLVLLAALGVVIARRASGGSTIQTSHTLARGKPDGPNSNLCRTVAEQSDQAC
jgi:hypothetical protein